MFKVLFSLVVLVVGSWVIIQPNRTLAHGEDKPGPNGGEIRMPGPFHVELKVSGREIWVYLLDMNFEKPRTAKSTVEVVAILPTDGATRRKLDCKPAKASEPPRFVCTHANYEPSKGQTLVVRANRGSAIGHEVSYSLPILTATAPHELAH